MADSHPPLPRDTASLCPVCLQRLPARRVVTGEKVEMVKECPEHGEFRALLWQGPPDLAGWNRPKLPSRPPVCFGESERGCPFDCGLCPEHGQHSCSALIEVTSRCNLRCPVCFADSATEEESDPSLDSLGHLLRLAREACGENIVLQLSGGEPTVRDDLPDIIRLARECGFSSIQLNSNGLRLAAEGQYAQALREAGLTWVYLQFDGTRDEIYRRLRGRELLAEKLRAVENCAAAGLGIVLVPTLVPGINDDDIGNLLRLGLAHAPHVRGVHFQPISYFGRFPQAPGDEHRLTLPHLLRAIEEQTSGLMRLEHFAPPGCEHSHCSCHGNFLVKDDGSLKPLTKPDSVCCSKPKPAEEGARLSTAFLTRQWAAPSSAALPRPPAASGCGCAGNSLDDFLERVRTHTFAVSAMAFQDCWNIDLERTRNCCIHVVTPQGRLVPFCLYNLTSASGAPLYRGK